MGWWVCLYECYYVQLYMHCLAILKLLGSTEYRYRWFYVMMTLSSQS